MDFLQRGTQQNQAASSVSHSEHVPGSGSGKSKRRGDGNFLRYITAVLLLCVTVLVVAILISIATGSPKSESKYVDNSKLQAVFLNNGQVYFGNITSLNDKYVRLQNIYYLRVNQTVQPKQSSASSTSNSNDVSLVKLGCELHGPSDQMLINRDQVTFWENLKSDGQVAKAVADYVKANPTQNCAASSNSSSSSSNGTGQ